MGSESTKFILSVDTEEDNWGDYSARTASLNNMREIPVFHARCRDLGIRPTYLLTYPVVNDPESRDYLIEQLRSGSCEIGAHCHPWNTPPFDEIPSPPNSLLCNLTAELQQSKVQALTRSIIQQFGIQPTSFRAGRWGVGPQLISALSRENYLVDSSIIPLQNWTPVSCTEPGGLPPRAFWKSAAEVFSNGAAVPSNGSALSTNGGAGPGPPLVEIPVTVSFLQRRAPAAEKWFRAASSGALRRLHTIGILERLNLVNRVGLLPEIYSLPQMIQLTERLIDQGVSYLNFTFHSCTLSAGLTPFTPTATEVGEFQRKIFSYLEFIDKRNLASVTLSEATREILGRPAPAGTRSSTLEPVPTLGNVVCG